MKNKLIFNLLAVCCGLFILASPVTANQEQAAIEAAEHFLFLIDNGHYAQSWEEAADFFKQQVPKQEWIRQISSLRPAFGRPVKRKVQFKNTAQKLRGAPDGDYLIIQYATSFSAKQQAMETVTPVLEKDGQWRVVGYYIR